MLAEKAETKKPIGQKLTNIKTKSKYFEEEKGESSFDIFSQKVEDEAAKAAR